MKQILQSPVLEIHMQGSVRVLHEGGRGFYAMKKLILKCYYISVTFLASLASASALANDGGIEISSDGAKAGTVVPVNVTDIRLVEEHVTITRNNTSKDGYADYKAEVHTKLVFWNSTKKEITQLIGFPVDDTYSFELNSFSAIPGPDDHRIDEINKKWDYSLKTKVNGKQFNVSKVMPGKSLASKNAPESWSYFVFDVTFPPNQKTVIEHKYEILPDIDIVDTPEESINNLIYGYISSTGQFWQGEPEKAVFEFRNKGSSDSVVDYSGPGEAKKEVFFRDGYTVYRATHIKPTLSKDVEFYLTYRGTECESFYDYAALAPVLNQLLDKEGSWSFNLELSLSKDDIKNLGWRDRILVSDLVDARGVNHVCRKGLRRHRPELIHKCVLIDGPANMRLFPGGPVIASINDGAFVHIYEQRGDWYGLVAAKESHCLTHETPYEMWKGSYNTPLYLGFTHKGNIKYNFKPTVITNLILRTHLDESFGFIKTLKREDKLFVSNKMFGNTLKLELDRTDAELNHPEDYNGFYFHTDLKSGHWLSENEIRERGEKIIREVSENLKGRLNAKLAKAIDKSDCATKNGQPSILVFYLSDMYWDFNKETVKIGCWSKDLLPVYIEAISQVEQIKTLNKLNISFINSFCIETKVSRGHDGTLKFDHELKKQSHYQWRGPGILIPIE